jgi:hypothetical protein
VGDQQIDQPHPHSWLNLHGIVLSDPLAAPPTALYRVASGGKARGGGVSQFSGGIALDAGRDASFSVVERLERRLL